MTRQTACPDWTSLVEARDDGAEDQRAWNEALAHRAGCSTCVAAAVEADPLLLFQDLPPVEVDDSDVASMQQRVAISRRFAETASLAEPASVPQEAEMHWSRRVVAAAAVLALVGAISLLVSERRQVSDSFVAEAVAVPLEVGTSSAPSASSRILSEHLDGLPLVEAAEAEVRYQMASDEMNLALVVHAGLDL